MGKGLRRAWFAAAVTAYTVLPLRLEDFWLSALTFAGIAAVGAVGLNLLIGYCGQVSLAHGFFLGVGAYVGVWVGTDLGLPMAVWLPLAAVVGAGIATVAGPFSVRLSGQLLVVVSLALVFGGQHVFRNWTALTGGSGGRADLPSARLGPLDFSALELGGATFSFDQGYFWLAWAVVAMVTVVSARLVAGPLGRAMLAVRDDDLAAAAMGIDVVRTKLAALALSGALGAAAGALYGSYRQFVGPEEWNLFLSIEYVAVIIVGGLGTVAGPVLGSVFLALVPRVVEQWADVLPFVSGGPGSGLSAGQVNRFVFGVVIVGFLLAEPRGLVALAQRATEALTRRATEARARVCNRRPRPPVEAP